MDDSGSYGETLEGATSCGSCQTCTTITQILLTLSEPGFFEDHDSVKSRGTMIGQLIQAGDPDWIIQPWMPNSEIWIKYIDWETLSYRAAVGCPTCRVIRDGILVFLSDDDFKGEKGTVESGSVVPTRSTVGHHVGRWSGDPWWQPTLFTCIVIRERTHSPGPCLPYQVTGKTSHGTTKFRT